MLLFIGLGNPGEKFINTRHNVGYMIINKIHNKNDFPKFSCKLNSLISTKKVFNQKLIIAKPETYMNNSGLSVLNI